MAEPMDNDTNIAARTQRFNEAARKFTPPSPIRHAKLAPFKEGIVELRQRGASLRLIREPLATVGVAVGTDTIARYLNEMNGEQNPQRSAKRTGRHRGAVPRTPRYQPDNASAFPAAPPQPPPPVQAPTGADQPDASKDRSRTRGPRIADPNNL